MFSIFCGIFDLGIFIENQFSDTLFMRRLIYEIKNLVQQFRHHSSSSGSHNKLIILTTQLFFLSCYLPDGINCRNCWNSCFIMKFVDRPTHKHLVGRLSFWIQVLKKIKSLFLLSLTLIKKLNHFILFLCFYFCSK